MKEKYHVSFDVVFNNYALFDCKWQPYIIECLRTALERDRDWPRLRNLKIKKTAVPEKESKK